MTQDLLGCVARHLQKPADTRLDFQRKGEVHQSPAVLTDAPGHCGCPPFSRLGKTKCCFCHFGVCPQCKAEAKTRVSKQPEVHLSPQAAKKPSQFATGVHESFGGAWCEAEEAENNADVGLETEMYSQFHVTSHNGNHSALPSSMIWVGRNSQQ